ncbi:hypothetical protein M3Y97_00359500 [Aphelenchoides bicaudatus]|nr:hypothetical protein M3Y97_00359500 [Aphelenchoides bicaudatus]
MSNSNYVLVKATYEDETRKWKLFSNSFVDLVNSVRKQFGIEAELSLQYVDSDDDYIELSSDEDLSLAIELEKSLKLIASVDTEATAKQLKSVEDIPVTTLQLPSHSSVGHSPQKPPSVASFAPQQPPINQLPNNAAYGQMTQQPPINTGFGQSLPQQPPMNTGFGHPPQYQQASSFDEFERQSFAASSAAPSYAPQINSNFGQPPQQQVPPTGQPFYMPVKSWMERATDSVCSQFR